MSLISMVRNYFCSDPDDGSVNASRAVIAESKQARIQMNEQVRQIQHDAFQTSVDQERIRTNIIDQMIIRKAGPDFLADEALTNQKGRS